MHNIRQLNKKMHPFYLQYFDIGGISVSSDVMWGGGTENNFFLVVFSQFSWRRTGTLLYKRLDVVRYRRISTIYSIV